MCKVRIIMHLFVRCGDIGPAGKKGEELVDCLVVSGRHRLHRSGILSSGVRTAGPGVSAVCRRGDGSR